MKLVNGVEIPDISFKPNIGESCYLPFPTSSSLYSRHVYNHSNEITGHLSTNGICYPFTEEGREVAILHAKAMLGIC
jgi:hypothetical protein